MLFSKSSILVDFWSSVWFNWLTSTADFATVSRGQLGRDISEVAQLNKELLDRGAALLQICLDSSDISERLLVYKSSNPCIHWGRVFFE